MANTRDRMREYVAAHPGQQFSELERTPDLSSGRLDTTSGSSERRAIAVLRRETARGILFHLLEHEAAEPRSVADALGIARSTLEWHLDQSTERGLVRKRRHPGDRITLFVPDPAETLDPFGEITPSPSDRMLDRLRVWSTASSRRDPHGSTLAPQPPFGGGE